MTHLIRLSILASFSKLFLGQRLRLSVLRQPHRPVVMLLDDDPELEAAMAAFPLEQLTPHLAQPQQHSASQPFAPPTVTQEGLCINAHPFSAPTRASPATPLTVAPLSSRTALFPPPFSCPPVPTFTAVWEGVASTVPAAVVLPLPTLLSEWHHLQADRRCGTPSLLNDPYEVCHALVERLMDEADKERLTKERTEAANSIRTQTCAASKTQKHLCSVYCQLMALLNLPSSPFAPSSLSSLRPPPRYEPPLLHQLACMAHNTALQSSDWSLASYFCHFALQLFALPDVALPADVPNCLSSLALYQVALLDELAARETASLHAVYGDAMLTVLQEKRRRDAESVSTGCDDGLTDMLDMQARMYVASGRRQWAEQEMEKEKAERKASKKRKHKKLHKLAQPSQWQQAMQSELDDVQQRLVSLLTQRTLHVAKCEQLLAVAFHLQLDELTRPLVEHIVHRASTTASVGWQLHYVELLCMLSTDEQLLVFASSTLTSISFPPLHFRCWQYLCERCWTAGTVLVRGGPSELGERLLAIAVRLLERACQCGPTEKVDSHMDEQQVLSQLNGVLDYVRERDQPQQQTSMDEP